MLTKNFEDYEARVRMGEIAIGYENPVVFARLADRHEALAIAIDRKTGERFRGIVVTRPDSGIKGLADLAGKRVLIVGKTSAAGFVSQKASLKEAGRPWTRSPSRRPRTTARKTSSLGSASATPMPGSSPRMRSMWRTST